MPDPVERLVLVDSPKALAPEARCTAYWAVREVPDGAVSIPSEVDRMACELRDEYCRWAHEVGATIIDGRTVRAHLGFWPDFSFWWMGLIGEKEPLRSPGIYTVFKLRALEHIYRDRQCRGLVYVGSDAAVHKTMGGWARAMGHPYQQIPTKDAPRRDHSRHPRLKKLPSILQGLGYFLLKCWSRYRHVRPRPQVGPANSEQATIVTYFPNIDLERTARGRFWSRYWEHLHDLIDEMPYAITWLWLYVDSDEISYRDAIRLRDMCNAAQAPRQRHFLLDDFISVRLLWNALRTYSRSCLAALTLRDARHAFAMPGSDLNFFPILKRDWDASLTGVVAMDGALTVELWNAAARALGPSVWTLFVWENQTWEHAALAAWRRAGNGPTIGAQHATLPPLDLRACMDPRELSAPLPERRPIPDRLAVNGYGARNFLRDVGFPADRLIVTEAVRYAALARTDIHPRGPTLTLLVVTGFKRSEALRQLILLTSAAKHGALSGYSSVVIKPHPFCPIEPLLEIADFTAPHAVVKDTLAALWPQADVAFVANSTSAVAEALHLGMPTAVCAPEDEMNLSPAFGHAGVPMVATTADLVRFLQSPSTAEWPSDYLLVDNTLTRWRTLLTA